jgi:DNA-binding beta-propeller fold protein YncE
MLALIYLALSIALGDFLCRRFYRFVSIPHRWAAAILVGILLSTWFTYLAGLAFAHTADALLWADLLFFVVASGAIFWLSRKAPKVDMIAPRAPGSSRWDWITLGALFAAACVLLMGTLYVNKQGRIRLYGMEASDFAPQLAIAQSFALGHNFPTEYPHYAGQPNQYHFLFYFQAGNLELLGLNLAWSVDVLSVLGLISMLALVMVLGELLFNSRVVGRVGAALFFFHGSPAFIQFLRSQKSFKEAVRAALHLTNFLPSGYPYRGENSGVWTQIVFINQRHLPFAIGIFLLILIFLVDRYRQSTCANGTNFGANVTLRGPKRLGTWGEAKAAFASKLATSARPALIPAPSFIFSGFLLGALPLWSAPVFLAAAAVLSFLLILFPCRWQMMQLGLTAVVVALPQLIYLRSGQMASQQHSLFHWGYIGDNSTVTKVIDYVASAFALKWPVIILALLLVSWFQRRFFIAMCSLFVLAFFMQLGPEALTSHKFLNIWLVMANLFAAYGLWWLWKLRTALILGPVIATALTASIVAGGVIDLSPIYNSSRIEVNYEREPLVKGLGFRTSVIYKVPDSLAAGVAGKDLSKTPVTAFKGGQGNGKGQFDSPRGIAIDRAGNIFVADTGNERIEKFSPSGVFITSIGTKGKGHGQFGEPNGIAIDRAGNIYVAEVASNHRVQKLAPDGTFVAEWAPGFYGPRRIAIGPDCAVYVVDQGRTRIVKFSPDGRVLTTWGSAGNGDGQFSDHTSVVVDPTTNKVYVADPRNRRIQVFDSEGKFLTKWSVPEWGQPAGFEDLAIDSQRGRLYASSAHMSTILVFDLQGNRTGTLTPMPPDKLNGPPAIALAKDKLLVLNSGSARVSVIKLQNR